jgi:glutamate--cysteine ligase
MDALAMRPYVEQLDREAFALAGPRSPVERIGAEVELIPLDAVTGRAAPLLSAGQPSTLPVLRAMAQRFGWRELRSAKSDAPEFRMPGGGRLCFEPGGQIEYAAPPSESVSALGEDLRDVAVALTESLAAAGISLIAAGVDPQNRVADVPLRLHGERYRRMDAHFARIGPHGARMMRQTASIQVSVDAGTDPLGRWRLLNALTPYIVAIFANSPRYAGTDTGHRSIRRHIWGSLDPDRTGIAYSPTDPVEAYARFALRATAILLGDETALPRPFEEHVCTGDATLQAWREHLTTLFPEVRPRGYFEVRSTDAIAPEWYAVPLVFLAGLTREPRVERLAQEIAGAPDVTRLARAGRCGLSDADIATPAIELAELALDSCLRLGPRIVSEIDLATAASYFDRYTRRRRSPADDVIESSVG